MKTATIELTTEQAQGLKEIHDDHLAQADRLEASAPSATERRRPGMLVRAAEHRERAAMLATILELVPADVISPPPPPEWEADGICQLPGDQWPVVLVDGAWVCTSDGSRATVEELETAGATRIPAVLLVLGEAQAQARRVAEAAAVPAPAEDEENEPADPEDSEEDDQG